MAVAVRIALTFFVLCSLKKASLVTCNSVCYSLYPEDAKDVKETYISTSLWQFKQEYGLNLKPKFALKILLILAGDIELCPGPRVNCAGCLKKVQRSQVSKVCDSCGELYHVKCLTDRFEGNMEKFYCSLCNVSTDYDNSVESAANVPLYSQLDSHLQNRGLKVLHLNVNGLLGKIDQIRLLLTETGRNIQILQVSESHLDDSAPDSFVKVFGYNLIRRDRKNGPGGGVCIYIREDLKYQRRLDLENHELEALVIEIFIKHSKSLLISVIYRPPDSSKYLNKNFQCVFNDFISTAMSENKEFILSGDLNCDYIKRSEHEALKDCLKINGFKQLIDEPTRITINTSSLIDIIATTHENNVALKFVYSSGISDHRLTGIVRKLNTKRFRPRRILVRNYKGYSKEDFNKDLNSQNWQSVLKLGSFNEAWDGFKTILQSCIDKHAPLIEKTVRGRDTPWLTSDIKEKIRERDYYLRKAKKSGSELDWSSYRRLRNATTALIRKNKANYQREAFQNNSHSPNDFWKEIKKLYPLKEQKQKPNSFCVNSKVTIEKKEIANGFCAYFTSIGSSIHKYGNNLTNSIWKSFSLDFYNAINPIGVNFEFNQVDVAQVYTLLLSINSTKAAGCDHIPTKLVRDGANGLATSYPGFSLLRRKNPGSGWSRVSQILGDK